MATSHATDAMQQLEEVLQHAAHLLPMQGPIGVFIHHNTLHPFQHLPFEEAVEKAAGIFGTEPYMREEQYRAQLKRGRIRKEDVEWVLQQEPNREILGGRVDRRRLRLAMLIPGMAPLDPRTIRWELEEGRLSQAIEEDSELFAVCRQRSEPGESQAPPRPLLSESVQAVNSVMIRLCAAYLDQGLAYWPMPMRSLGFYRATLEIWTQPGAVEPRHLQGLHAAFAEQSRRRMAAREAAVENLQAAGIPMDKWEHAITQELLALPGWAGLFHRLEEEPDLAPHEELPCTLLDYFAVRTTLSRVARANLRSSPQLHAEASPALDDQHLVQAVRLFEVARLLGLDADSLRSADGAQLTGLRQEIDTFDDFARRRVLHLAYEFRHERLILGPLARHRQASELPRWSARPTAQVFFCIDEREESMRRNLEEIRPDIETLSAAGFYGIAVNYAGIDDAHGVSLCPVVVKPQHAVRELPIAAHYHAHARRRALRNLWARIMRNSFVSSRTLVRGAFSTAILGTFSMFPLIVHVLTPFRYAQLRRTLNRWILPEPRTELTLMRTDPAGHHLTENLLLGFDTQEKIDRVASVLGPAGLYTRFARLVVVLGHGSNSLNNPHESAHDCGACGGRRGGPNGRLFAAMANRPEVRRGLAARGILIPEDTWFIGGYHDTCTDDIDLFDLEAMPETHRPDFEETVRSLDQARALDAKERARRFEACPPGATPEQALWHVQERAEHLAEPRPEYGHCTNAVCIVGRREATQGLFFDRRAFLVSYDPNPDPTNENLARLLGAAIPVCGGISLEYYFSFIDNEGYGCGTKLPHNVTGLVGVMNGQGSDLRTGLPWQMVEIHEPVRILFVIETTPERLMNALESSALLMEFVTNRWIRVSTLDPDTGAVHIWRDGRFVLSPASAEPLPQARTSVDWYQGRLEHLPVAKITLTA